VTDKPTAIPTMVPTEAPTAPHPPPATPDPTERPTGRPTRTPTNPPTRLPTKSAPTSNVAKRLLRARGCARQYQNLCKTCTAQQCVAMAAQRCRKPNGDGTVMWSPRYNRWWGCRCCRPPAGQKLHVNGNWELWAGGDYVPPPPPPPTPSPTTWPSAPGAKPPRLLASSRGCWRQIMMVCKTCTAPQCVHMAQRNSRCQRGDGSVMWSPRYNKWWGCRCCQTRPNDGPSYRLHRNGNWQLWAGSHYKPPKAAPPTKAPLQRSNSNSGGFKLVYRGHSCRIQMQYLGRTFRSPHECMIRAKRIQRCTIGGAAYIMWAPRYNRWWGCRCCRNGSPGSRNRNWDMYRQ
jgi:hypothetical protein